MPPIEDITPPRSCQDDGVSVDRFGQKRTASGALILEDGEVERGLPQDTIDVLDQGGFFDPAAFDDVEKVKTKAYVHLMPGLPNEVVYVGIGVILLLSFVLFDVLLWPLSLVTGTPPRAALAKARGILAGLLGRGVSVADVSRYHPAAEGPE